MEYALPHQQLLSDDRISAVVGEGTERTSDTPACGARPRHLPRVPLDDSRTCTEPQAGGYVWGGVGRHIHVHVRGRGEEGIRVLGTAEETADMGRLQIQPVDGLQRAGRTSRGGPQTAGLAGLFVEIRRARGERRVREGALRGRVAVHV